MGFFSGRLTCARYRVAGKPPRSFAEEHLENLKANAIGTQKIQAGDGSEVGWLAGDHILDTRFDLAKNVLNDSLHFALRVDTLAIPGDLLRAYTQVELQGLIATNPSGFASSKQKREARELAKERLENEARDGRYLRRKSIPILWDAPSNELLVGSTSPTMLDRLHAHFEQTFKRGFEVFGAGPQAFLQAEASNQSRGVDDATPTIFVSSQQQAVVWLPDEANRDFLGNEFILWLWYYLESESDTLKLADDSEVAVMIARTLHLECPRGQTGKETISSDSPSRLPEAHRAIQAGKLPRKVGITMVRHDTQYELTLSAESLAITGARLPAPESDDERARLEERVTQIRHLLETLDLMYAVFGKVRLGDAWPKELVKMKKWLQGRKEPA